MNEDLSKHDEIIAEAREKYTVHHCGQCEFRKSCYNKFDSYECKNIRQSIMLGFGIEDGYFTKLLNRLEAAHKREREATCEKSLQVGNGAKMREAVEAVIEVGYPHNFQRENPNIRGYCYDITKAIKKCFDALAMPPRNCDVGTPREQERRMDEWCHNGKRYYRCLDDGCPNCNLKTNCVFDWLQMPYEEGGAV